MGDGRGQLFQGTSQKYRYYKIMMATLYSLETKECYHICSVVWYIIIVNAVENNANLPSAGDQNIVPGWHHWKGRWYPFLKDTIYISVWHKCLVYPYSIGLLQNLLPLEHPIFQQALLARCYFQELRMHVHTENVESSHAVMRATGVSPFVTAIVEVHKVWEKVIWLRDEMVNNVGKSIRLIWIT